MRHSDESLIAPCGIDCAKCQVYLAPSNPEIMAQTLRAFKQEENLELRPDQVKCSGCPGTRECHFTPKCGILRCCVDEKGLRWCSECAEFVCGSLRAWAKMGQKYQDAIRRLEERRRMLRTGTRPPNGP